MFGIELTESFKSLPPELAVALIAMLPIAELRGAIPAGIGAWHLAWPVTMLAAVVGNIIPVIFILWLIDPLTRWLRAHSAAGDRFFTWLFERTRRKFYDNHARWGDLGLVIFVAIPLPATGAWTGALAAYLFGIKPRKALFLVLLGVIIAAVIVTALTLGLIKIF